jgi:hypothetical protein
MRPLIIVPHSESNGFFILSLLGLQTVKTKIQSITNPLSGAMAACEATKYRTTILMPILFLLSSQKLAQSCQMINGAVFLRVVQAFSQVRRAAAACADKADFNQKMAFRLHLCLTTRKRTGQLTEEPVYQEGSER